MTTKEFNKLNPGTRVAWTRAGEDGCTGVVSKRPDLNYDAPHYMIDWADGLQTDGRDFRALEEVVLFGATASSSGRKVTARIQPRIERRG